MMQRLTSLLHHTYIDYLVEPCFSYNFNICFLILELLKSPEPNTAQKTTPYSWLCPSQSVPRNAALHVCHVCAAEVLCGLCRGLAWRSLKSGDLSLYSMIIITCVVMDEIVHNGQSIL
jgi:hypothetical protein